MGKNKMDKKLLIIGCIVIAALIVAGYFLIPKIAPEAKMYYFYYAAPFYTATLPDIAKELASDDTRGIISVYKAEIPVSDECPVYSKVSVSEIVFAKNGIDPKKHNGEQWGYYLGFASDNSRYKINFWDYSSAKKESSAIFEVKSGEATELEGKMC